MRGSAFGLEVSGAGDLPLAPRGAALESSAALDVVLLERGAPWGRAWPEGRAETLRLERDDRGATAMTVQRDAGGTMRIAVTGFGEQLLWPGAERVEVQRDPAGTAWSWQRLLGAQTLPIAAAVCGLEVVHACAVAHADGGCVAICGPSGSGKSTLALTLALAGHAILTDDVLALSSDGETVVAHPGVPIVALRPTERELGLAAERRGLARSLPTAEKELLEIRPPKTALALRAMVVPQLDDTLPHPCIEELRPPDPTLVMRQAFAAVVRPPARLLTQLAVHGAFGRDVPVLAARMRSHDGPGAVAALVRDRLLTRAAA